MKNKSKHAKIDFETPFQGKVFLDSFKRESCYVIDCDMMPHDKKDSVEFRCSKCEQILFRQSDILFPSIFKNGVLKDTIKAKIDPKYNSITLDCPYCGYKYSQIHLWSYSG